MPVESQQTAGNKNRDMEAKLNIFQRLDQLEVIANMIKQNQGYLTAKKQDKAKYDNLFNADWHKHADKVIAMREKIALRLSIYLQKKIQALSSDYSLTIEVPMGNEEEILSRLSKNCEVTLYEPATVHGASHTNG